MACPSSCREPGCTLPYRDHLLGIAIASAAIPSRRPAAVQTNATSARWERDLPAYKRLRGDGLQPPATEGAADLEARATCEEHVTTGMTHVKPSSFTEFESHFGHKAVAPATGDAA